MTFTFWNLPISGNWNDPTAWTEGVPIAGIDAVIGSQADGLRVVVSDAETAASLTLSANGATLTERSGGSLSLGALIIDSSTAVLGAANTIGNVTVNGGRVELNAAGALGANAISISGGEILSLRSLNLSNSLSIGGSFALAAAHGKTLKAGGGWIVNANSTITFGDGSDGTVKFGGAGTINAFYTVGVHSGTLQPLDDGFVALINNAGSIQVDAGATLDVHGFDITYRGGDGTGTITNSAHALATLSILPSHVLFDPLLTGALNVHFVHPGGIGSDLFIERGVSTYTGTTTIDAHVHLQYGEIGGQGHLPPGAIVDNGILGVVAQSDTVIGNVISGTGGVGLYGDGVTFSLTQANAYSFGTGVELATLALADPAELGTGSLGLYGANLLATASMIFTADLIAFVDAPGLPSERDDVRIAAAHRTTLTIDPDASQFNVFGIDGAHQLGLHFGDTVNNGSIVFYAATVTPIQGSTLSFTVDIDGGSFVAGDSLTPLLGAAIETQVAHGATLNTGAFDATISGLMGDGTLRGAGTVTVESGNFSGAVNGALTLRATGDVTLSGGGTFKHAIADSGATLTLANAAHENVDMAGGLLVLDDTALFDGVIQNFGMLDNFHGDAIELDGIGADVTLTYRAAKGTLTVDDGTHVVKLHFEGDYTLANFSATLDPDGHTDITFVA